jgi:hypothetical protein
MMAHPPPDWETPTMSIRTLCYSLLAFTLLWSAPDSMAKTKKKKATDDSAQERIHRGSGESTTERDRRLLRECKGRPNAGACAGYTG